MIVPINDVICVLNKNPKALVSFSHDGRGYFMRKDDGEYVLHEYFEGKPGKELMRSTNPHNIGTQIYKNYI